MSNTPETDQLEECDQYKVDEDYAEYNAYRRMVEHARKLERQRDRYRDQADALVDRLGQTQERMIDAERQRDRLAEALRMITTFDYTDLQCDNGHGARFVAIEALKSLTTNEQ